MIPGGFDDPDWNREDAANLGAMLSALVALVCLLGGKLFPAMFFAGLSAVFFGRGAR